MRKEGKAATKGLRQLTGRLLALWVAIVAALGLVVGLTSTAKAADGDATYELTNTLENGGEYLIVDTNASSDGAHVLRNNNNSVASTSLAVNADGDTLTISTSATDIVWTATADGSGFLLTNGGYYLKLAGNSNSLQISDSKPNKNRWTYDSDNSYLTYNSRYLYYESSNNTNNFTTSNSQHKVYLYKKVTKQVALNGIMLDSSELTMEESDTQKLTVTFDPANATNKKVTWASDNEDVATVDSEGNITAVAQGTATITATSDENDSYTATCAVTVAAAQTVTYKLADTMEPGKQYLVALASGDNWYVLSNEAVTVSSSLGSAGLKGYSATVEDGKATIRQSVAAKTLFTADGDDADKLRLKLGDEYLYTANNGGLRMESGNIWSQTGGNGSSNAGKYWHYKAYDGEAEKRVLWFYNGEDGSYGYTATGSQKYVLAVSEGNFVRGIVSNGNTVSDATNIAKVYLFGEDDTPATYTVSFVTNCDVAIDPQTVEAGGKATKPTDPTREGFAFGGWYADENFENAFDFDAAINADATAYAKWNALYTVSFVTNCDVTIDSQTVEAGGKATKPTDPTKTGYTFGGWYADENFENAFDFDAAINADATAYAKWTAKTYTVTFNKNDDAATGEMSSQTLTFDQAQTLSPNAFAKDNWSFAGWATSADGDVAYSDEEEVTNLTDDPDTTGTVELFAKWTQNAQVSVTFLANDGTEASKTQTLYAGVTTALEGNTFTRTGYDFAGWNTAADGSGSSYTDGDSVTISEALTLYAQWTIKTFKVTFVDDDGTTVLKEATEYEYGTKAEDVVRPDDPTKEPTVDTTYTFAGWDPAVADVTADATYKATYTSATRKYTVTFVDDDGTTVLKEATEYEYGTKAEDVARPDDPTKAPTDEYTYAFAGWDPAVADVTADATYKATYTQTAVVVWKRLAGNNRYKTMATIVQEGFEASDEAILCTGENFPDALVAASLAGSLDSPAPIILTKSAELSVEAEKELKRLGVKHVFVLGGESVVSNEVLEALGVMNDMYGMDIKYERIAGNNRQDTSLAVMQHIAGAGKFNGTIVVATGKKIVGKDGKEKGFADALSISPWCYKTGTPVLLTNNAGKLTEKQAAAAKNLGVEHVIIVGGSSVVSDEVYGQLGISSSDPGSDRLGGLNRYETSSFIAAFELREGMSMANTAVTTGENFPDALAGAALCGKNNSVLLLAKNKDSVSLSMINNESGVKLGYVLGGTSAVSEELFSYLEEAVTKDPLVP